MMTKTNILSYYGPAEKREWVDRVPIQHKGNVGRWWINSSWERENWERGWAGGGQARINIIEASIDQSGPSNDHKYKYAELLWTRREERVR